ncbi:hypothetical protein F4780DRAFT_758282 [Xylariomycetidae sp. FL0641]|nr:hypothetical protein F4780DRAFT_758282 [Xylariomycetidae sp. FL0641]
MGIFSQIFYPGANTDFAKARLDRSIFTILVVYAILNSLIVAILTLVSATSHGISYHGMVSYGIVHTVFFSVVYAAYLFFRARIHWVEQHHSTSLDSHPLPSAQAGLLGKVKAFAKRLTGPGREKSQTRAVEGFRVNGGSHDHDTSYRPQPSPSHPYPGAAHHGASTHASHSSTSSGSTSGLSKPDNDPFSSDHALDHDDRYAPDHHSASSFHSSPYVLPPLPYQTTSPNHHHHHHHHNARQHSLDHLMDPEEIDLASL